MLINKDYENPRYGDASIPYKHPTYLPNHRMISLFLILDSEQIERNIS